MENLIKIGAVKPKHASEIARSRIGLGFEKLDRAVFNPNNAYDKVAATGAKWIRLQSGWMRTEREKGVYDFTWLDEIVDNLSRRGMIPWLCLCYGNPLYDESAAKYFGAVGCPPIFTEEQIHAWDAYACAVAVHFKGRISYYEVWNEPDGQWCWKNGPDARQLGVFTADTARAVRKGDPDAKIIGGVVCRKELSFLSDALAAGMGSEIDAISFHQYDPDEGFALRFIPALRGLCDQYNRDIEIIQGETGCQSRSDGKGALSGGAWTQRKQAKFLARHTMADLTTDIKFTSYFSSLDMIEALTGLTGQRETYLDFGYFGVLAADFDENGYASGEYTPKMSYRTLQTICSIFADNYSKASLPILCMPEANSMRVLGAEYFSPQMISQGFTKPNGSSAYVYWHSSDLMTTEFDSVTTLQIASLTGDIRLVDLLTGDIYVLPENMTERRGESGMMLKSVPVRDYPLLLTFGNFI